MRLGIDWLTIRQPNNGQFRPINDGKVVRLDAEGNQLWSTAKHLSVEGSHSTNAQVRVTEDLAELSFNPARWNRAHNVRPISWDDALEIANDLMTKIAGAPFTAGRIAHNREGQKVYLGAYVTRLDACTNIATGNPEKAQALIRQLCATKLPNVKTTRKGSTVYFGQSTKRRTRKAYVKGDEIRANNASKKAVAAECDKLGLVRMEVKLKSDWLRENGMRAIQSITQEKIQEAVVPQIKEMKVEAPDDSLETLTVTERGVLRMWQAGDNPRQILTDPTFYRHRKNIKEKTGYDIADDTITPFRKPREVIYIRELTDEEYDRIDAAAERDLKEA